MGVTKDYVGKVSGLLTVVRTYRDGGITWVDCICECGGKKTTRPSSFKSAKNMSCGCLNMASGLVMSPTYHTWAGMKARCSNSNHRGYKDYGGRGISVCERWQTFSNFYEDMGEKPDGMEIDRKDNDKDYEPFNCRWVSRYDNIRNRSVTRWLTYKGETLTLSEWARKVGLKRKTLDRRLERGWSLEDALTQPLEKKGLL